MAKKDNINLAEKFQKKLDSNEFKAVEKEQDKSLDFLFSDDNFHNSSKVIVTKNIKAPNNVVGLEIRPKHATIWLSADVINLEEKLKIIYANKNIKYNRSQILLMGLLKELESYEVK